MFGYPDMKDYGGGHTVYGHGGGPGMGMSPSPKEMMMEKMWEYLGDDQKKILMKRMIDGKIMMKEGMIKHLEWKIETMKMVKKMIDEC
ncbi:MAG TPA: hypothetical protein VMT44_08720 [Methanoregula sp.]|nr:hypothetical protein [Methanoregula sp.]